MSHVHAWIHYLNPATGAVDDTCRCGLTVPGFPPPRRPAAPVAVRVAGEIEAAA